MRQLIKYFSSYQYAKMFQDGQIYMNSLSWFWDNGFEDQKDMFEGIAASVDKQRLRLPSYWNHLINGDILFRLDAYRYCNLTCFHRVDISDSLNIDLAPEASRFRGIDLPNVAMNDFGIIVAIIKDEQELLRRVLAAMKPYWFCISGDVAYQPYPGSSNGSGGSAIFGSVSQYPITALPLKSNFPTMKDCFVKHTPYGYQREWRICLFRNQKNDSPCILNVGNLADIVELVPSSDIGKRLIQMYAPCFPCSVPPQTGPFRGNISRTALQRILCDFENGTGTLALSM